MDLLAHYIHFKYSCYVCVDPEDGVGIALQDPSTEAWL